ncbi:MAG: Coenzyme F420 hydrogenase/dehydrogenase, beta subunit C-terminal domain [Deltaproteobacteria bacterium]|nr:Coenzyme F420 hydrogenase/dehydrogenase, beta subunit C-terminal domain [Deltaproteobacteria bacterium]
MAIQEQLKKMILDVLPDVDCVIGWGPGPDPLRGSPFFMRKPEDVESFMAGPMAVQNPALFLPEYKGKKVGVVVKGCDSRSVVQLISEDLIKREEVVIIGFPCDGVLDVAKVENALASHGEPGEITAVEFSGGEVKVTLAGNTHSLKFDDVKADKCGRCAVPNAVMSDFFAGIAREASGVKDDYEDLAALEKMSLEERFAFWENEMSRCLRCYACRNACPMCVCRDHCVASSRIPHWISQADSTRDKLMFQVIHAVHLAGRCTGCGECQRVCPVGIPVLLLKRTLSKGVTELFDYAAGMDTESKPPLLTFQVEEATIKERNW